MQRREQTLLIRRGRARSEQDQVDAGIVRQLLAPVVRMGFMDPSETERFEQPL